MKLDYLLYWEAENEVLQTVLALKSRRRSWSNRAKDIAVTWRWARDSQHMHLLGPVSFDHLAGMISEDV